MKTNLKSRRAFTLIELLVCITIIGILTTFLLPALQTARSVAKIAVCQSNERQQGMMVGQYEADAKTYLPLPMAPHWINNGNAGLPTSILFQASAGANSCPYGSPKTYAIGFGWFYVEGYLPPIPSKSTGRNVRTWLDCPEAPVGQNFNSPLFNGRIHSDAEEAYYGEFSSYINAAISGGGANPQGGNWDCNSDAQSRCGYVYRGWSNLPGVPYQKASRADAWKSTNAIGVDSWGIHDSVAGGANALYHDGHSAYGNQNLSNLPSYIYYSVNVNGYSLATAQSNSYFGYAYAGGTGTNRLWTYIESGVQ